MMAARPRAAASSSSSLRDQPSLILTFIVIDLFLLQMDEPLLSERFSKTAEGIRALARSERYQEMRRMILASIGHGIGDLQWRRLTAAATWHERLQLRDPATHAPDRGAGVPGARRHDQYAAFGRLAPIPLS